MSISRKSISAQTTSHASTLVALQRRFKAFYCMNWFTVSKITAMVNVLEG